MVQQQHQDVITFYSNETKFQSELIHARFGVSHTLLQVQQRPPYVLQQSNLNQNTNIFISFQPTCDANFLPHDINQQSIYSSMFMAFYTAIRTYCSL